MKRRTFLSTLAGIAAGLGLTRRATAMPVSAPAKPWTFSYDEVQILYPKTEIRSPGYLWNGEQLLLVRVQGFVERGRYTAEQLRTVLCKRGHLLYHGSFVLPLLDIPDAT